MCGPKLLLLRFCIQRICGQQAETHSAERARLSSFPTHLLSESTKRIRWISVPLLAFHLCVSRLELQDLSVEVPTEKCSIHLPVPFVELDLVL